MNSARYQFWTSTDTGLMECWRSWFWHSGLAGGRGAAKPKQEPGQCPETRIPLLATGQQLGPTRLPSRVYNTVNNNAMLWSVPAGHFVSSPLRTMEKQLLMSTVYQNLLIMYCSDFWVILWWKLLVLEQNVRTSNEIVEHLICYQDERLNKYFDQEFL